MTAPTPRYEPLTKRIAELRKAAKNAKRPDSTCICAEHLALRKLAAPAHEMAACVEALVRAVNEFPDECSSPCPADPDCWLANARAALDALAKVLP